MEHPVCVIVGLGHEVGHAVARRFSDAGQNVVVADADEKRVERARRDLPERINIQHAETHTAFGLLNCFALAEEAFSRLDNLVVIPRIAGNDTLAELDTEAFARAMSRATSGAMLAAKLFAERLEVQEDVAGARAEQSRQRGTITFVLSQAVEASQPGKFTSTAAQGAVQSVMRAAALELAPQSIRVNAVAALRPRAEADEAWLKQRTPLGRAALADEIAEGVLYLSSQGAAIITGETLVLDGGRARLTGLM